MCANIDIAPKIDPSAPSFSTEKRDPPMNAIDAYAIGFTSMEDSDALVCPLPDDNGLLKVNVIVGA